MPDYRDRPPVDAPRPTPLGLLREAGWRECLTIAALVVGFAAVGYLAAVAGGLAWR